MADLLGGRQQVGVGIAARADHADVAAGRHDLGGGQVRGEAVEDQVEAPVELVAEGVARLQRVLDGELPEVGSSASGRAPRISAPISASSPSTLERQRELLHTKP